MDLRPWNYWTRDGLPHEGTGRGHRGARARVGGESEASGRAALLDSPVGADEGLPSAPSSEADRLLPLMPGAGHIVHMPAHIYLRVGRYADVVTSNQQAVAADEDYIAQCRAQGMYPLGYYPHNIHFVWLGATMSGQSRLAIESARKAASSVAPATPEQLPFVQGFLVVPYFALVRFGTLGRDPRRAEAGVRDALHARDLALRARLGVRGARAGSTRPQQELAALAGDRRRSRAGEDAAVLPQSARYDRRGRRRSARRRHRGAAEAVRRGHRAFRSRRAARGRR